jgi:aldehyde dehydrogenase (NAD+)
VPTPIERVFALQQAHQWEAKASTAEQRKEKLRKLKSAVEAHADEIVAAVKQDTRKPEPETRTTRRGSSMRRAVCASSWVLGTFHSG